MRIKTIFYSLFLGTLISCSGSDGLVVPTSNTIKITETDSKDSIIIKAAHVVPTPNQYAALKMNSSPLYTSDQILLQEWNGDRVWRIPPYLIYKTWIQTNGVKP